MLENLKATFLLNKEDKYLGDALVDEHVFKVDEPIDIGGTNLYPTPTRYLLGSLASCIGITLRMYSERKEWDLGTIKITVQLEERKTESGSQYVVKKDLEFGNKELDEKQLKRLKVISTKCPVSKILEKGVVVEDMEMETA